MHIYEKYGCCLQVGNGLVANVVDNGPMEGDGFLGDIAEVARKAGIPIPKQKYKGEKHAVGLKKPYKGVTYNFAGPGTKLSKRLSPNDEPLADSVPLNGIDSAAMKHDISYRDIGKAYKGKQLTKQDAMKKIFAADKKFKSDVQKSKDQDPIVSRLAQIAISAKELGERSTLLPSELFSLAGEGLDEDDEGMNPDADNEAQRLMEHFKRKPGEKLRAMVGKGQKGGIAPAAILIPVIASLAGSLLGKVFDKIVGQGGSGRKELSDEEKRVSILNKLGKLKEDTQIKKIMAL
jgi:hypothetical protein